MVVVPQSVHSARLQLAAELQRAVTLEEVQSGYLRSVERVIPCVSSGLYRLDPGSGAVMQVLADDLGTGFTQEYESYGRADDPVLDFVVRNRRAVDSSRAITVTAWESSGARAALQVAGLGHSMEAPVIVMGELCGTLNFARPSEDRAFTEEDVVSAQLASEQMGLAVERSLRFETLGRRTSVLEDALDRVPEALLVSDYDGAVIFRNRAARNHLAVETCGDSSTGQEVLRVIDEATATFRSGGRRTLTRTVVGGQGQVVVRSYRLPTRSDAVVTMVYGAKAQEGGRELPSWGALSRREQEIAQLVSRGLTTRQIADVAFISENTVKQHLKRIFVKTEVRNRAELIQVIWSSGHGVTEAAD